MADRRGSAPHPARGEVFSARHRERLDRGEDPRDTPWPDRLRADTGRETTDQGRLNPPNPQPTTPRPPR